MTDPSESETGSRYLELDLPSGSVPLGFAREGPALYLVGRDRAARWPVQILREGAARVRIDGRLLAGSVDLVTEPPERERVLQIFRNRYGPRDFDRWYASPSRVLRVTLGGRPRAGRTSDHYHEWLRAEFDNVATDYDRHITGNRINRLLRDRSLAELRRAFRTSRRLLEIGCGSGMETLPLLEEGHELVCIDISSRMLEVVREKARRAGVAERLETVHTAAAALPELAARWGPGSFDGAYSTYGALNCEEHLDPILPALAGLLRPGTPLVAGVYNRYCLFEMVGYGLTGRWARATGRTRRPMPVGSSRFCVDVFALSVSGFHKQVARWFEVERVEGVPVVLPPSDLARYTERFARGFDRLARWDLALGQRWPFRLFGDHFLMTLRRRQEPGG